VLSAKQMKAVELMVLGDMNQRQIAATVRVSEKTLWEWKKNDEFMNEYRKLIRNRFQYAAAAATNKLVKLLESNQDGVALGAINSLLDRTGYKPEDVLKIEGVVPVTIIGINDVED
jgi:transposase